ncbi:MAG: cbb3-type cytochrome oxidase assembly protein CcoS [Moritella sp.]|uniref:cbb3-type cytochrome oxidase assembly protein CcoS n=1 Tax=Moritella sp. TaxID=78556 RepID=UPI001DF75FEC|nr:cbb3-type cytochrome oxidase assembly protein CcoS [Moritella sp.]NQZ51228.1 cbb3-type cytochrome oxidase assembly protein CcoS [Moritella sp.]
MEIIFMLIPIAMIFVAIAVAIFFWAVKSDQFEDLEREGSNILFDDDDNNNESPVVKSVTKDDN